MKVNEKTPVMFNSHGALKLSSKYRIFFLGYWETFNRTGKSDNWNDFPEVNKRFQSEITTPENAQISNFPYV